MAVFRPISQPVNEVELGGIVTPGLAEVQGLALEYDWEVRKGDGVSGATKVLKGRGLTRFTVKITLYDENEIAQWEDFVSLIRYPEKPNTQTVKGLDINHPVAAFYGIKSVTVTRFLPMEQLFDNAWETGLELEEYREPVVVVRKVAGSKSSGSKDSPKAAGSDADPIESNPELDAARQELERQRALNKAAGVPGS